MVREATAGDAQHVAVEKFRFPRFVKGGDSAVTSQARSSIGSRKFSDQRDHDVGSAAQFMAVAFDDPHGPAVPSALARRGARPSAVRSEPCALSPRTRLGGP